MNSKLKCGLSRDCFDRFGDDLCELILQYLSFEYKIIYECVSKQFKRTIFNRQHVLKIEHNINNQNNENALMVYKLETYYSKKMNRYNMRGNELMSILVPVFEQLLRKCKQINHIIFGCDNKKYGGFEDNCTHTYNQLIGLIAQYCHHLHSIESNNTEIKVSENVWQYFFAKCGKTLRSISLPETPKSSNWNLSKTGILSKTLTQCPNITRIVNITLSQLIGKDSDVVVVPKLNEIHIEPELMPPKFGVTIDMMKIFVQRYAFSIMVFKTELNCNKDCIQFVDCLSQLINLKKLSLVIKRLYISDEYTPQLDYIQLLRSINSCNKLKNIKLRIAYNIDMEPIDRKQDFSVQLLNCCSELQVLNIDSKYINDSFVHNIELYLPKLYKIRTKSPLSSTDECLHYLSHLKQLRSLDIDSDNITDAGVECLIDNCLHIKSLSFQWSKQITIKTIDKLLIVAKQRPKIKFSVKFTNHENSNNTLQEYTDNLRECFPPNIDINFVG